MPPDRRTFAEKVRDVDLATAGNDYEMDHIPSSSAVPLSGLIKFKPHSRKSTSKWKPFNFAGTRDESEADEAEAPTELTTAEDNGQDNHYSRVHAIRMTAHERDHGMSSEVLAIQEEPNGGMVYEHRPGADLLTGIHKTTLTEQQPVSTNAPSTQVPPLNIQPLTKSPVEFAIPQTRSMGPPSIHRQASGTESDTQRNALRGNAVHHRPAISLDTHFGSFENLAPQGLQSGQVKDSGYATTTSSSRPSFSSDQSFFQREDILMPLKDRRTAFTFEEQANRHFGPRGSYSNFASNTGENSTRGRGSLDFTYEFPKSQNQPLQWGAQQYSHDQQSTQRSYSHSQAAYIDSEEKRIAVLLAKVQPRQQPAFSGYGEQQSASRISPSKQVPARTVLYDPMQSRHGNASNSAPRFSGKTVSNKANADAPLIPFHKTFRPLIPQAQPDQPPRSSGSFGSGNTLRASEPEPGWQDREARIYQGPSSYLPQAPASAAYDTGRPSELSGPTPQNWNGPFFTDDIIPNQGVAAVTNTGLGDLSRNRGGDHWWNASATFIPKSSTATKSRSNIRPSSKTGDRTNEPLLEALFQNLSAYSSDPRDYFSKFAPPPEWCIDKSLAGKKSFFGEDWGKAPSRVGRDPRYRPLPSPREGFFGSIGGLRTGAIEEGRRGLSFFSR